MQPTITSRCDSGTCSLTRSRKHKPCAWTVTIHPLPAASRLHCRFEFPVPLTCTTLERDHTQTLSASELVPGLQGALCGCLQGNQGVLTQLRQGSLDLVVATAMAEEGLDIVQCQMVVRFDLPKRALEFIQSRGRARARDSELFLMVEHGCSQDLALIEECRRWGGKACTKRLCATALHSRPPCTRRATIVAFGSCWAGSLAGCTYCTNAIFMMPLALEHANTPVEQDTCCQRHVQGSSCACRAEAVMRWQAAQHASGEVDEAGPVPAAECSAERYAVPSTGALVTLSDAKARMFHFCSKLPCDK